MELVIGSERVVGHGREHGTEGERQEQKKKNSNFSQGQNAICLSH